MAGRQSRCTHQPGTRLLLPDLMRTRTLHASISCSPPAAAVHVPALPATVVNCSGAGDCLVAGCLYGLARGLPAAQALCYGVAAATAAVQSESNVPAGLDAAAAQSAAAQAHASSTALRLPLPACSVQRCCCAAACNQ